MSDVKVGQVWADNDKRSAGRLVRVVRLTETHAIVMPAGTAVGNRPGSGRVTRIRLDRFRPNTNGAGYQLVQDVGGGS
jgi:hypothetical protein